MGMNMSTAPSGHTITTDADFADWHKVIRDLPSHIIVQYLENRIVATSDPVAQLIFDVKHADDVLGLTDLDIATEQVAKTSKVYQSQNNRCMQNHEKLQFFNIDGPYCDDAIHSFYCEKQAIVDQSGNSRGCYTTATMISNDFMRNFSAFYCSSVQYYEKADHQKSLYINNTQDQYHLTQREQECLFLTLYGKPGKDIAKLLKISQKTVETHLANIRRKLEVYNRSQLIEKSIQLGYLHRIPQSLIGLFPMISA